MKKLVILAAVVFLFASSVWAQKVWTNWQGSVEIYPRQNQYIATRDIPPGPGNCNVHEDMSTAIYPQSPDQDNEVITGDTRYNTNTVLCHLTIYENDIRQYGQGRQYASRDCNGVTLATNNSIYISFSGNHSSDPNTFFFTHGILTVTAQSANPNPNGPGHP